MTESLTQVQLQKKESFDELAQYLYRELREIAHRHRLREGRNLTLQTTTLVHEAYIRLASAPSNLAIENNQHLKAIVSKVIRNVLIDYSRRVNAKKRNVNYAEPEKVEGSHIQPGLNIELLDLEEALKKLGKTSPKLEQIVECRFFGGMTTRETSQVLDMSPRTIERNWHKAKLYILRQLRKPE